jgi:hypothetical protein
MVAWWVGKQRMPRSPTCPLLSRNRRSNNLSPFTSPRRPPQKVYPNSPLLYASGRSESLLVNVS